MENNSVQNLVISLGSQLDMITLGTPCSRNILPTNSRAYCVAAVPLIHGMRWVIFVKILTNTPMVVLPSDLGKSVTRSAVISYHHFQKETEAQLSHRSSLALVTMISL